MKYTSKYKIGDKVNMHVGEKGDTKVTGTIESVKFTETEVYYAIRTLVKDGLPTVRHHVDSALIEKYI